MFFDETKFSTYCSRGNKEQKATENRIRNIFDFQTIYLENFFNLIFFNVNC